MEGNILEVLKQGDRKLVEVREELGVRGDTIFQLPSEQRLGKLGRSMSMRKTNLV